MNGRDVTEVGAISFLGLFGWLSDERVLIALGSIWTLLKIAQVISEWVKKK